jgi:RNA polymerase sigma factor (sigma-70 family)
MLEPQRDGASDHRLKPSDVGCLYVDHGSLLTGYACAILGDRSAAEDVVHQVFTRLLRGDVSIAGRPLAYLCRAVRNTAMNHQRDRSREARLDAANASWLEAPNGLAEAALAVEAALRRLPAGQREVIVLRVWGQLTFQEIADALDASSNTIASRYRYGLAKLRDILKPLGVE